MKRHAQYENGAWSIAFHQPEKLMLFADVKCNPKDYNPDSDEYPKLDFISFTVGQAQELYQLLDEVLNDLVVEV